MLQVGPEERRQPPTLQAWKEYRREATWFGKGILSSKICLTAQKTRSENSVLTYLCDPFCSLLTAEDQTQGTEELPARLSALDLSSCSRNKWLFLTGL